MIIMKTIDFDLISVSSWAYSFASACLMYFLIDANNYESELLRFLLVCAHLSSLIFVKSFINDDYYYWTKRQIPGPKPNFVFRDEDYNVDHIYNSAMMKDIYDKYSDEPVVGIFSQCRPTLFLRDLGMIEDDLIKSFSKFPSRGLKIMDPDLFSIKDPEWKPLRRKLSPIFTSAKIKKMFDTMSKCIDGFIETLNDAAKASEPVEFCELTGSLITNIVALCLFGINSSTLQDEDSEFQEIVPDTPIQSKPKEERTRTQIIKFLFYRYLDKIKGLLKLNNKEDDDLFSKAVKSSMDDRRKNGVKKNDFLGLLIHLKDHPEELDGIEVSDNLLLAQAVFFFQAGQERASLTISHALYELALNSHIQNKLRIEIAEASAKNGGKLDYESVYNAKYLDKVVKETFRKYPPVAHLIREADSEYTFPNTNITLSRRLHVAIPINAIHCDPKFYPEPEKFDPERFDEKVAKLRPKMSYLPFGDGPRNCIGQRFIIHLIKLCLAVAIQNFKFKTCRRTVKAYKTAVSHDFLAPDGGIYLKVKKIVKRKEKTTQQETEIPVVVK